MLVSRLWLAVVMKIKLRRYTWIVFRAQRASVVGRVCGRSQVASRRSSFNLHESFHFFNLFGTFFAFSDCSSLQLTKSNTYRAVCKWNSAKFSLQSCRPCSTKCVHNVTNLKVTKGNLKASYTFIYIQNLFLLWCELYELR